MVGGINPSQLTPGIFTTGSISATINASSPFIGQPISIVLANTGFPSSGTQVQFDNVRLTSQPTAVPEPSTWAIASAYLVGMVAFGRLKRRGARGQTRSALAKQAQFGPPCGRDVRVPRVGVWTASGSATSIADRS